MDVTGQCDLQRVQIPGLFGDGQFKMTDNGVLRVDIAGRDDNECCENNNKGRNQFCLFIIDMNERWKEIE